MPNESLPDDYEWFSDQIAGHHPSVYKNGKREIGILKKPGSDKILKLKQDGQRGLCEESVYRLLYRDVLNGEAVEEEEDVEKFISWLNVNEKDRENFSKLVPKFYGTKQLVVDGGNHEFLVLADASHTYRRPAILDVKMGRLTFDPNADAVKREKESGKYPSQMTLGFRILGYRIHRGEEVKVRGKPWGMKFDENDVSEGLSEFFEGGREDSSEVKTEVLYQLKQFLSFFESQTSFHYYASSLLFLYETDPSLPAKVQVFMIDFSHVFPGNGERDENYLFGLKNLSDYLSKI